VTLAISEAHARQLARLRARSPDVRRVVIGAAALGHHVELTRVTSDVDLAVVIVRSMLETFRSGIEAARAPR
jgi:hypothetical protein